MVCTDCLQTLGECFDLICYAFFFRGVAGFLGFPVLHLVVLDTEHTVHLAVVVDLAQSPTDFVVARQNQNMIQHISLRFCVCSIACIHIVGDSIGFFYHLGEGFVGFQQLFGGFIFLYFIDVGVVCGVVCVVIAVQLLTQEVLWVAVVCTPTIVNEGLEVCLYNFLTQALDVGLDVQLDEVIAKAIGE